jgi:hypothetical protein
MLMRAVPRKLVVVATGMAVAAGLTLTAAPAGASVPAAPKGLCKILTSIQIDPSSDPTEAGGRENAGKLAKKLNKAAKKAKGDIKKTLKTMAKYFQLIADDASAEDIAEMSEAFGKATAKYATYVATTCISENIPDISIPDLPGA